MYLSIIFKWLTDMESDSLLWKSMAYTHVSIAVVGLVSWICYTYVTQYYTYTVANYVAIAIVITKVHLVEV